MAEKSSQNYGQKLISLFALLWFTGKKYSLKELSQRLKCSKQTVSRLVKDIQAAWGITIKEYTSERQKYFYIERPEGIRPELCLSEMELMVLHMCRAFARHLLGDKQFDETTMALLKNQILLPGTKMSLPQHFDSFLPGTIDYTPYQETIHTLIEAMEERKICRITYQAIRSENPKTFYIQPLKMFSRQDTIYLHARKVPSPEEPYEHPEYDPLLVVHRINKIEKTEKKFEFPQDYDFEKLFNKQFGVIKKESFRVEVKLTGWSARFAVERIWSPDQEIKKRKDGSVILSFTSSSEKELISWLLSFRDEARLIRPEWLVKKVAEIVENLHRSYSN